VVLRIAQLRFRVLGHWVACHPHRTKYYFAGQQDLSGAVASEGRRDVVYVWALRRVHYQQMNCGGTQNHLIVPLFTSGALPAAETAQQYLSGFRSN
jgi:hypothetical protein